MEEQVTKADIDALNEALKDVKKKLYSQAENLQRLQGEVNNLKR